MNRCLKLLGPTLIAVMAMSAAIASSATALKVTVSEYPAILTSSQSGVTMVTSGSTETTCGLSTEADTVVESVENLTVAPIYEGCWSHAVVNGNLTKFEMKVTMRGCDYVRHGGKQVSEDNFANGTVDIQCPEEVTGPTIEIWYSFAPQPCVYTVEATGNVGSLNVTDETGGGEFKGRFSVEWELPTSLKRDGSILCGAPNQSWVASWSETVWAYQDLEGKEGQQISVATSE